MVPDPPHTPRLDGLVAKADLAADPLYGTAPAAVALLAHLRTALGLKRGGRSLQTLADVPLIHSAPVMEFFGFQRRHMLTQGSFKYVTGWPRYSTQTADDGAHLPPVRGRSGWGVHPALSFT